MWDTDGEEEGGDEERAADREDGTATDEADVTKDCSHELVPVAGRVDEVLGTEDMSGAGSSSEVLSRELGL